MKTVEEKAREYVSNQFSRLEHSCEMQEMIFRTEDGFLAGYNEAMRWRDPKEELPAVYNGGSAYENKDLIIVKLSKYDSYEFAVLIKVNGKLMWDIPDMGTFELQDIIGWRPIE